MKMKALFTLISMVATAQAKPMVVGLYLDPSMHPEAACKVVAFNPDLHERTTCSATMIAPDRFITARHCFSTYSNDQEVYSSDGKIVLDQALLNHTTVTCTTQSGEKLERQMIPDSLIIPNEKVTDLALGKLDQPMAYGENAEKTISMKVATEEQLNLILKDTTAFECTAFGYGHDNNDKVGELHGVLLTEKAHVTSSYSFTISQETSFSKHQSVILSGDSGGTIACRWSEAGSPDWVLIGVTKEELSETPDHTIFTSGKINKISQERIQTIDAEASR